MNKNTISGIAVGFLLFVFNSCTDDPLNVGFELLPSTDLLGTYVDTLSIKGYTVKGFPGTAYNYVGSQNSESDFSSIGHVIDPIFGDSWAEATMQLTYNNPSYDSDTNVLSEIFRSCKLYLKINEEATFGGENGFEVEVHTLTKLINHKNPTDYIVKSDDFDIDNIVSVSTAHNVYITHNDIPDIDSNTYYLVIELDESFSSPLMDSALYTSEATFNKQYPGFYLRTNATNPVGGIELFYFKSSFMVLEYDWELLYKDQNNNDSIITKTKYNTYKVNNYQSLYRHSSNFSPEGPFGSFLGDSVNASNQIYVQSLGGVRGMIEIPGLEEMKENLSDSIGVNYAELVLPVNKELCDTSGFYMPKRISLHNYYPGIKYGDPIVDDNSSYNSQSTYFSGYLDTEKMEYRINVTQYIHLVIYSGKFRNKLYVLPSKLNLNALSSVDYKAPSRVIIPTENSNDAAYLRIIYTNTNY